MKRAPRLLRDPLEGVEQGPTALELALEGAAKNGLAKSIRSFDVGFETGLRYVDHRKAVFDFGDRYLVAKTDPITFATSEIGWYAVNINANDVAVMGAQPRWFLATVLLPAGQATPEMAEEIFEDMLYDEYAQKMAKTAQFGLAENMYLQINHQK